MFSTKYLNSHPTSSSIFNWLTFGFLFYIEIQTYLSALFTILLIHYDINNNSYSNKETMTINNGRITLNLDLFYENILKIVAGCLKFPTVFNWFNSKSAIFFTKN